MQRESMVDIAQEYMNKHRGPSLGISLEDLFLDCCYSLDLAPTMVKSKSRLAKYVCCRRLFYVVARQLTNVTLSEIGIYMGGLHHTSILHHLQVAVEQMKLRESRFMEYWLDYMSKSKYSHLLKQI